MSPDEIKKKRHVLDNVQDIGKLKLKQGSIMEYIPTYNNLFNKGKLKVFPLQSLEEIMVDPSKYNHTREIVNEQIAKRKERESRSHHHMKTMRLPHTKTVLGSKYRF